MRLPTPAGINGALLDPAAFVQRASKPLLAAITRLFGSQPRSTFISSTAAVPNSGPSTGLRPARRRRHLMAGPTAEQAARAGAWLQVVVVAGGKAPLAMYRSSAAKLRCGLMPVRGHMPVRPAALRNAPMPGLH